LKNFLLIEKYNLINFNMYKVLIQNEVDIKIDNFIDSYTNTFLTRFNDTWIFDEYLITQKYKEKSIKLNNEIYLNIQEKFSKKEIFWYRINKKKEKECIIFIWNYMIVLWYNENKEEKIRMIEYIIFNKK
jgi:hypothetical protein